MKKLKRTIVIIMCVLLIFSVFSGCNTQKGNDGNSSAGTTEPDTGKNGDQEVIELDFMYVGGWPGSGTEDTAILKKIEELTGVRIKYSFADAEKKKVIFAGGDTTDCLVIGSQNDILPAIQGNLILPLTKLIDEHGPNVKKYFPERLKMAKDFLSDGSGEVYVLPIHAGSEGRPGSIYHSIYLTRWDYYKELGCPEIKGIDDYLDLLVKMVNAHPKTDEGNPVYGISFWANDIWNFSVRFNYTYGYYHSNDHIVTRISDGKMVYNFTDEDSPYWQAAELYNKAYRLGILDPDSFTQKNADFRAKVDMGQILTPVYDNYCDTFEKRMLENDPKSVKGFQVIPVEGTTYWADSVYKGGWNACFISIPKTCKSPKHVMKVINLLSDYDGARLAYSGIKGEHWDIIDGKPALKDEVVKMYMDNSEESKEKLDKIGFGHFQSTLQTLTAAGMADICPDGGLVNLFMSPDIYKLSNKPVDTDFSNYYGAEYPMGVFAKKIEEGTIFTHDNDVFDLRVVTGMGTAPEDIARIDVKLNDMALKAIPKIVMAKSEDEFKQLKSETINKFNESGAVESRAWWQARHDELTKIFVGK